MAKMNVVLPTDIIKDIEFVSNNAEKIFGRVTKAGAEVVYKNIMNNMPAGLRNSPFRNCVKITRSYRAPSKDAISTKVGIYGYFINELGQETPAPLVANIFEFGRSNAKWTPKPFFRKSFNNKSQIKSVMLEEQLKASKGLLK